jgi:hypothetical protein
VHVEWKTCDKMIYKKKNMSYEMLCCLLAFIMISVYNYKLIISLYNHIYIYQTHSHSFDATTIATVFM